MGWRQGLRQRARQGIPALLEVDALLQAHGVLAALPGARIAPGLVRFQLAAVTCEGLQGQGLRWLQGARQGRGAVAGRVPRYRPWKAGADGCMSVHSLGFWKSSTLTVPRRPLGNPVKSSLPVCSTM